MKPPTTNPRVLAVVAAVLIVAAAIIAPRVLASNSKNSTTPQLATASLQSFPVVATASGLVIPDSQVQLNFSTPGRLTEVDVKVGDQVTPGQVIAKIDDTSEQATLTQAEAVLQGAQAALQAAQNPLGPSRAQDLQNAVAQATAARSDAIAASQSLSSADATLIAQDNQKIAADQQQQQADGCSQSPPPAPCTQDAANLRQDQNTLQNDQIRQQQDTTNSQLRINEADASLSSAQANLAAGQLPTSAAVSQAQAQVAEAQGQVAAAQAALAKTVLTAPAAGTVVSVGGQVGEQAGSASTSTGSAPGSTAPLPSISATGALSLQTSAFVVISQSPTNIVVAPFSEGDALRLTPNMSGSLSFDALPGTQIPAHVIAVAQNSSVVAGVVEYFASLSIDKPDARLKDGMTANASMTVASVNDVLAVPSTAIYSLNNKLYVDVWYQGRGIPTAVTVGAAGQKLTQITSGLSAGEQVVLSAQNGLPSKSGATPSPH